MPTSALLFSNVLVLVFMFMLESAGYAQMSPGAYGKFPRANTWLVESNFVAVIVNGCLTFAIPLFLVGYVLLFLAVGQP